MGKDRAADVLESVAANVRSLRRRRGMTQAQLAEKADVELRQLQRAESGRMDFGIVALAALAAALDVTPGMLFKRAKLPPPVRGRPPTKRRASS